MAAAKTKSKTGLMTGLVLLVVFIGAGAVFGLAMSGKINIPGITPKKKPIPAAAAKPKPKAKAIVAEESPVGDAEKPASLVATKQGAVKLAEVWNEMPTPKLIKVVDKWTPTDLALVLNEMDPEKVADVLGTLDPKKASTVSHALKLVAAQIQTE